jgi:type IV pilus assembly protein PilE
MTELVIVLCVIGILMLLVLPDQTNVVVQARALEAQGMLNQLHGLEKSYFFRFGKYTSDFDEIGFIQEKTVAEGGQAIYRIEVVEASTNSFKARATALTDFDGDGNFNTWEIDHQKILQEIVKD